MPKTILLVQMPTVTVCQPFVDIAEASALPTIMDINVSRFPLRLGYKITK